MVLFNCIKEKKMNRRQMRVKKIDPNISSNFFYKEYHRYARVQSVLNGSRCVCKVNRRSFAGAERGPRQLLAVSQFFSSTIDERRRSRLHRKWARSISAAWCKSRPGARRRRGARQDLLPRMHPIIGRTRLTVRLRTTFYVRKGPGTGGPAGSQFGERSPPAM